MAFVRLSSNKSSAKAFPKVSITLLYYRYSIISQASIADSIKQPVLLALCENAGLGAWLRLSMQRYLQILEMETAMPRVYPQRHQLEHTRKQYLVRNWNKRTQARRRSRDAVVGACHSHAIAPTYG